MDPETMDQSGRRLLSGMKIASITPRALYGLKQQGRAIDLIDVRTAQEYQNVHAEGARLIPLDQLTPDAVRAGRPSSDDRPIYVICKSGGRSMAACQQLTSAGLRNVVNVSGGTTAWEKAGLPVVRK
jgi:rhodanese-related sulfurtransferase